MSRQILLRLSLIEFEHLRYALEDARLELEELMRQDGEYVTEVTDRIDTALAILNEHEKDI